MSDSVTFVITLFSVVFAFIAIPVLLGFLGEYLEHKRNIENKLIDNGFFKKKQRNKQSKKISFKEIFLEKFFETLSTLIIVFFVILLFDIFNISSTIKEFFINLLT